MPIHVIRITSLLGSVVISATALAAPKPFDPVLVGPGALPTDEEVVLHYVANCSPTPTTPLRLCVEAPLDIDGQTGVDMVIGVNDFVPKRFYSGLNNGLFSPPQLFGVNGPTSGLKLADLDNDGDLDMVETIRANGTNASNTLYVNTAGTLQSLLAGAQPLDAAKHDRSSSVVIGDVNNDGRLDVIIINETQDTQSNPADSGLPYGQTNYLYLNTQATTPNNVVFGAAIALDTANEERYTRRGLLIDVEGDGDLDLVVTSADNHLDDEGNGNWLYVNGTVGGSPAPAPGTNPFAAAIPLAGAADDTDVANAIAAGDIDGDGDPDLVFSTWSRMEGATAVPASNRFYINNSTPGFINFQTTATFGPARNHTNIRLGDFDNDNDLDALVLVHMPNARSRLHLNTGIPGAFFDSTGLELLPPEQWPVDRPRSLDIADLNNDGSLDVVVANREQVGLRYLNNDQCSASGCGAFTGPFANYTPAVPAPISTVTVPAGSAPIDVDTQLGTLTVTDPDNVYPTDFTAVVLQPSSTADYTCTLGAVANGADSVCVGGQITPVTGAEVNGSIGPVQVKISDGVATSAAARVDLLIQGASPNAAPTITPPGPQTAIVGAAFNLAVTATDPNTDALSFAATGLPAQLSMSAGGVISGTPTTAAGAPFTVTVTVNDGRGGMDSETFQLSVQPANRAPVFTAPGPQTATVGVALNLSLADSASDADGDPVTFSATGLPAGFTMSAAGVITGTATDTTGSPFTVTLGVTDGKSTPVTGTFQLTVQPSAPPGNRAPVFTAPGPQSGIVGVAFNLSLAGSASDADGDPLTFAATGLPAGITLSPAGLLAGSPTTATGSPFAVTVTVTDGRGGTTPGTFQFTVSNPTSGGSGGGGSGGGGSFGFLEVLGLLGMGALAARRRRGVSGMPQL